VSLATASTVGLLAFLLHGLIDFNFRIPANVFALAVVAGIAVNSMLPRFGAAPRFHEVKIEVPERAPRKLYFFGISFFILLSCLTMSASIAHAHASLANILIQKTGKKGTEPALRYLSIAEKLDPLNSEYPYARGRVYEKLAARERWNEDTRKDLYAAAAKDYIRASKLQPANAFFHLCLGYVLSEGTPESTTSTAEKEFRRALSLNPSSPKTREYLALWRTARTTASDQFGKER
jgi:tetratricopeptide (TPR) repeat protein